MAFFKCVLLTVSLLVATSSAAPQDLRLGYTIPEECKGKGFCTIRPEYYDEIEAKINNIFPQDLIVQDVNSRSSSGGIEESSDDDDNCPSERSWESVYAYDYPKGTKMDIIVQTKVFPQIFAKVTCKYGNKQYENLKDGSSQCFTSLGLGAFNMESRCQESYATRSLMVYDPEEDSLKMKNYTVPVCCSCQIRKK